MRASRRRTDRAIGDEHVAAFSSVTCFDAQQITKYFLYFD